MKRIEKMELRFLRIEGEILSLAGQLQGAQAARAAGRTPQIDEESVRAYKASLEAQVTQEREALEAARARVRK